MLRRSLPESALVAWFPTNERDSQVSRLENPWVADEGALDCAFRRTTERLRLRGLAFDRQTTVFWDEAGVIVVRRAAPEAGHLAVEHPVAVRERFQQVPCRLRRIDYFRGSCWIGSRYQEESQP